MEKHKTIDFRISLNNKSIDVLNTNELYQKYTEQHSNLKSINSVKHFYIICCKNIIIDPNDVLYLSSNWDYNGVKFAKPYIIGYGQFANSFFSLIDIHYMKYRKNISDLSRCVYIFLKNNNVLCVDKVSMIQKKDISLSPCENQKLFLLKDKQKELFLLDMDKLESY